MKSFETTLLFRFEYFRELVYCQIKSWWAGYSRKVRLNTVYAVWCFGILFFVILGEKKCKTELDFIHREVSDWLIDCSDESLIND